MLDKGGAVKDFVEALQQLTNPDMIFKVMCSLKKTFMCKSLFVCFILTLIIVIRCQQDWWDSVKNQLEKNSFDKKQMSAMYNEMYSLLGNQNASGHGAYRRKFIQVWFCIE